MLHARRRRRGPGRAGWPCQGEVANRARREPPPGTRAEAHEEADSPDTSNFTYEPDRHRQRGAPCQEIRAMPSGGSASPACGWFGGIADGIKDTEGKLMRMSKETVQEILQEARESWSDAFPDEVRDAKAVLLEARKHKVGREENLPGEGRPEGPGRD